MTFFKPKYLEAFQRIETPFYFYNLELLESTLDAVKNEVKDTNFKVHYAIKANANTKLLQLIKQAGLGIDCVSGQEVQCALDHGFQPHEIAFAGVGKTDQEINHALDANIFSLNVESIEELIVINELAKAKSLKARVALRFNPNVNAKTHHYITTGLEENKFGINLWDLDRLFDTIERLEYVNVHGLHFHIGSQILDLEVYKHLCNRVNDLQELFRQKHYTIQHINVGGGLGVNYAKPDEQLIPDFKSYFNIFKQFLKLYPGQSLHFELGRSIVGQCATLISKVLYVKQGLKTNFLILDAGMTELIRPALYQASHKIENVTATSNTEAVYDVVGPICESSDCFGKAIRVKESSRGDLIAIRSTGAYGEVMTSQYNLRDKVKAVYSDEI